MSLFNTNKNKDKKKTVQLASKPMGGTSSTKSNNKSAARPARITGRAQRGS